MKDNFREIYIELAEVYIKVPVARWWRSRKIAHSKFSAPDRGIHMVHRALRRNIKELGLADRIRPDAYHFLLVNLHQMICLPILVDASVSITDKESYQLEPEGYAYRLEEDLNQDIKVILKEASSSEQQEITGHTIIKVVADVYEKLKTASSNAWG